MHQHSNSFCDILFFDLMFGLTRYLNNNKIIMVRQNFITDVVLSNIFSIYSHNNSTCTNHRWRNIGLEYLRCAELPKVKELTNSEPSLFFKPNISSSFIFISMSFFSQAKLSQESSMILLRQDIHNCTHCTGTGQQRKICPPTCTDFQKAIFCHLKELSRLQGLYW